MGCLWLGHRREKTEVTDGALPHGHPRGHGNREGAEAPGLWLRTNERASDRVLARPGGRGRRVCSPGQTRGNARATYTSTLALHASYRHRCLATRPHCALKKLSRKPTGPVSEVTSRSSEQAVQRPPPSPEHCGRGPARTGLAAPPDQACQELPPPSEDPGLEPAVPMTC